MAGLEKGGPTAFWKMADLLARSPEQTSPGRLEEVGIRAGLPAGMVTEALNKRTYKGAVERSRKEGERLGVVQTPTLFVNGRVLEGFHGLVTLQRLIETEEKLANALLKKGTTPEKLYTARVFTNMTNDPSPGR
jgi:protein-disulfide isomerase